MIMVPVYTMFLNYLFQWSEFGIFYGRIRNDHRMFRITTNEFDVLKKNHPRI